MDNTDKKETRYATFIKNYGGWNIGDKVEVKAITMAFIQIRVGHKRFDIPANYLSL